jgi:hypothetical protein
MQCLTLALLTRGVKVEEDIKALRELRKAVHTETDLFMEQIRIFESMLNQLQLGLQCWIDIRNDGEKKAELPIRKVGYGKLKKWGLVIAEGDNYWPIEEAPKFLRIAAVPFLPELVKQMRNATVKHISKLGKVTEEVKQLNELLKETKE